MWRALIAWGDRHGYVTALLARVLAPMALGAVLGLGLVWLVVTLPRPLAVALVVVAVAAMIAWMVREWRWTRRMQQEIRRTWERFGWEDRP